MKKIIKTLNFKQFLLILLATLSLASCRKAVEEAQRNIRFEGIEGIELQGLTGVEVVARVTNDSNYDLALETARLDIYYGQERVASILLREPVAVPRHTGGSISSRWSIRISDLLLLYEAVQKARQDDISRLAVSFSVAGRGGPAPVRFSREMMPLSDFLHIFGLSLQDVKNYLSDPALF